MCKCWAVYLFVVDFEMKDLNSKSVIFYKIIKSIMCLSERRQTTCVSRITSLVFVIFSWFDGKKNLKYHQTFFSCFQLNSAVFLCWKIRVRKQISVLLLRTTLIIWFNLSRLLVKTQLTALEGQKISLVESNLDEV